MDPSLLPSLTWFAHVAHHRSFTKAAAEMGVSRANLSQNVKALERRLNVKLLYRTTRDMSLTEEGRRLYEAWYPALIALGRAVDDIHRAPHEPEGLLRVNTSRAAGKLLIEPHFDEFCSRYPKLNLELVMDDGLANIIADGCDAGIRVGESLAEHMVAVPITPAMEMAVVATPAYLERFGEPATPADLAGHNCLRYRLATGAVFRWEFTSPAPDNHAFTVEPRGTLTTNDDADDSRRLAGRGIDAAFRYRGPAPYRVGGARARAAAMGQAVSRFFIFMRPSARKCRPNCGRSSIFSLRKEMPCPDGTMASIEMLFENHINTSV